MALNNDEWLDLYRYLIAALRERELTHIVAEIEDAAARPVIEEQSAEEDARVSKISKEVGRIALRPRTPAEAFAAAVEVLHARLIEVPGIGRSLTEGLAPNLVFRSSREDVIYSEASAKDFSADDLTVSAADFDLIKREMALLTDDVVPVKSA